LKPKGIRNGDRWLLKFLVEAAPLIKTNVDLYLKEVNDAVDKQLRNLQCEGFALEAEGKDQAKKAFGIKVRETAASKSDGEATSSCSGRLNLSLLRSQRGVRYNDFWRFADGLCRGSGYDFH
jgi:hypothetical protein